jgi:hypothetical protein
MTPHSSDRIALGDPVNNRPSTETMELFVYNAPSEEPVTPTATSPTKSSSMNVMHSMGTFAQMSELVHERQ